MKGYLGINSVTVPKLVTQEGHKFLRLMGERGSEGLVLWVGTVDGTTFNVTDLVIPRQKGVVGDDGVCVVVDTEELRRLNYALFQAKKELIAQLHSHPTYAYHSDTDDEYPIVTTMGGLSLVVPDFASRPFDLRDYATYRLSKRATWDEMRERDVLKLIKILG